METPAFGFRLRANAPEGQKRFPISNKREEALKQKIEEVKKDASLITQSSLTWFKNWKN